MPGLWLSALILRAHAVLGIIPSKGGAGQWGGAQGRPSRLDWTEPAHMRGLASLATGRTAERGRRAADFLRSTPRSVLEKLKLAMEG